MQFHNSQVCDILPLSYNAHNKLFPFFHHRISAPIMFASAFITVDICTARRVPCFQYAKRAARNDTRAALFSGFMKHRSDFAE